MPETEVNDETKKSVDKKADLIVNFARELFLCLVGRSHRFVMVLREELVPEQRK